MREVHAYIPADLKNTREGYHRVTILEPGGLKKIYSDFKGSPSTRALERLFVKWDGNIAKVTHLLPDKFSEGKISPIACYSSEGRALLTRNNPKINSSYANQRSGIGVWSTRFKIKSGKSVEIYDVRDPQIQIYEFRLRDKQEFPRQIDCKNREGLEFSILSSTLDSQDKVSIKVRNKKLLFSNKFTFAKTLHKKAPKRYALLLNGQELCLGKSLEPIVGKINAKGIDAQGGQHLTWSALIDVKPEDYLEVIDYLRDKVHCIKLV